jgi:MSHA type pilus biogenesis protein MshL
MAKTETKQILRHLAFSVFFLAFSLFMVILSSCASPEPRKEKYQIPEVKHEVKPPVEQPPSRLEVPEFIPVQEEILPTQTKVISISARNTPLRDILYTIAEAVSLNLVMERGVNPDIPLTMTLNNVTVKDALDIIFNSVDYFYSIKQNVLFVTAMKTKIFELGRPGVIQKYSTDIGGDMLGGNDGEEEKGELKGEVSMQSTSDSLAFQFWDALEKSLETILKSSSNEQSSAQPSFTVNRMAGTIMVTASKKGLERVENYIENLKKVLNRQVLIEARIVEIQLSDELKYGINWGLVENWKGVGNIEVSTSRFTNVVDSTGPTFQIGITGQNFTSLINALQEQGDVKTLSNPRISILNGQTAMLTVGRNTSFISRVETTTTDTDSSSATTTYTIETTSVLSGVIFGLVPYISEDNKITLTITPIISNLVELEPQSIGSGSNSVEIKLPTVDLREMSSTVSIENGEMVVLGGLIDRKEKVSEDKVPILSDIPIIGNIFKSVDKSYAKTELVIMLMPRIVTR